MQINSEQLKASEDRAAGLLKSGQSLDTPVTIEKMDPAVVKRRLTYFGKGENIPSETEFERAINGLDLVDEFYLHRAILAARPVCRIILRNASGSTRGYATGFMIAPGMLMTNWHVFQGDTSAEFAFAEFNYTLDIRGEPVTSYLFRLTPHKFFLNDKALDYAVIAVDDKDVSGQKSLADFGFLRLIPDIGKAESGDWLTIIQHPEGQRRQYAIRENQLVRKQDTTLWYKSDTAQGSSGAPVMNDSFQVVALHHMGVAPREGQLYVLKSGEKVASLSGVDDDQVNWIANEGIRVSVLCAHLLSRLRSGEAGNALLRDAIAGNIPDILASAMAVRTQPPASEISQQPGSIPKQATSLMETTVMAHSNTQSGAMVVIPLELKISLGWGQGTPQLAQPTIGQSVAVSPSMAMDTVERFVVPWHDEDYENRMDEGYDKNFLGIAVPLPKFSKTAGLVKHEGEHFIPYVHFSICLSKERRLALVAASNVDYRKEMRTPDPSKSYDRKDLGGLQENDRESWITDPRIGELYQIPDAMYNNDRGSFDKGHVVRRDDVCWGASYQELRRANGDTYHLSNCSPQVAHYNQSSKGGVWGVLEEVVKDNAKTEKLCVFAGAVLRKNDRIFKAKNKKITIEMKIPKSFWKVIVAKGQDGKLQTFGFLLDQDLGGVNWEFEFDLDPSWEEYMMSLADIEKVTGHLFKFDPSLHASDQHASALGQEVMRQTGVKSGRKHA
jgi:endonuclease G, mitochondrial